MRSFEPPSIILNGRQQGEHTTSPASTFINPPRKKTNRAKFPSHRPRKPAPNARLTARKRRHGLRLNPPPEKTAVPLPQVPHTSLPAGHQKTRKPTPNDDEYVYLIKTYNEDNKSGEKTDYETERHTFMQKAQAETKLSHIVCWDADDDNPHGNISEPVFRITKDGMLFAGCTTRYEENTMVVHEVEKRS